MDLQKLIALTEELESLDIELSSTKKSYEDLKTKREEKEKQINELTKDSEYKTRGVLPDLLAAGTLYLIIFLLILILDAGT
jgi:uncharacterized protein YlxW (UPF0749 family)